MAAIVLQTMVGIVLTFKVLLTFTNFFISRFQTVAAVMVLTIVNP